jgi:hypothetical protein
MLTFIAHTSEGYELLFCLNGKWYTKMYSTREGAINAQLTIFDDEVTLKGLE